MTDVVTQRGVPPQYEETLLQSYLNALGLLGNVDGKPGPETTAAIRNFQQQNGLVVDGIAGEKTWTRLFALNPDLLKQISAKWLSAQDLESCAQNLQVEVATVKAVYQVESGGTGFWGLKPKILFEGHVFWKQLQAAGLDPQQFVAGNEDILYPTWDPTKYVGGLAEYSRLDRARAINVDAANSAASWGLFQILGENAKTIGYASVDEFVTQMNATEGAQLDAFGRYVSNTTAQGKPLAYWLQQKQWAVFAARYNGPQYQKNGYDTKLAEAYSAAKMALQGTG